MKKLNAQEVYDLFICLSVGGLYPEEMLKNECIESIQLFKSKEFIINNLCEMLEIDEDEKLKNSLENILHKIEKMTELETQEILKKYLKHYSFFDRTHIAV